MDMLVGIQPTNSTGSVGMRSVGNQMTGVNAMNYY